MAGKPPGYVHPVTLEGGDLTWEKCIGASERMLIVLDCHQRWCGPCETMQPTLQRLAVETEQYEERLLFASADLELLEAQVRTVMPSDCPIKLEKQGCMPFFLLLRNKVVVSIVNGANAPMLVRRVQQSVPAIPGNDQGDE